MTRYLALVFAAFVPFGAFAQDPLPTATAAVVKDAAAFAPLEAANHTLDEFLWLNRVLIVFADSPNDPAFRTQMQHLSRECPALVERDVVVIVDTAPATPSPIRRQLRPRGFSLVWVDRDGGVRFRKPLPWTVREISQAIDRSPLRRQEMLEGRPAGR